MLEQFYLKNFAIIEAQTIHFQPGLNVLSGETGAGKSILIDALGLQLGDRAESHWLRQGSTRFDIQAAFSLSDTSLAISWLQANEFDDDDNCQLRRTLNAEGKSRCYINGIPTTVANTRKLGEILVNIHGQHAHQSLTSTRQQLNLLDQFGHHHRQLSAIKAAYKDWQNAIKQQQQLEHHGSLDEKLALMKHQYDELQALQLHQGEFATLEHELKQLNSAQTILDYLNQINTLITGDHEQSTSISSALSQAQHLATQLSQIDAQSHSIEQLLEQASIYLNEAQSSLTQYADHIEINPERLAAVNESITSLYDVARKHRIHPDELLARQAQLAADIKNLTQVIADRDNIDNLIQQKAAVLQALSAELSKARQQQARYLIAAVEQKLTELNLPNVRFDIEFTITAPQITGTDHITFMFAPNPGQGMQPLHKIASGGELSRISLAIQVASVSERSDMTLIFDEIDSGVGGATAEVVGRLLKTLAQYNQIICVTHLAQVAAFADHHIRISKASNQNETFTQFDVLDENARIQELARMSGGIELDKKTLAHASNIRHNALRFTQAFKPS